MGDLLTLISIILAILSLFLFLRIYRIQASSAALVSLMSMRNAELLTEVSFAPKEQNAQLLNERQILEILSYLNLVGKLYLNNAITINMLRTYEGVIIDLLKKKEVIKYYLNVYRDFKEKGAGEPPYINLIYSRYILLKGNFTVNKGLVLSYQRSLLYMTALKLKFNFTPNYGLFDKLCEHPDFQLNDNGKIEKQ